MVTCENARIHKLDVEVRMDIQYIVEPTCCGDGSANVTAVIVSDEYTKSETREKIPVPARGHSYGEATYEKSGSVEKQFIVTATKTCSACDENMPGHTVTETVVADMYNDTSSCGVPGTAYYKATFDNFDEYTFEVSRSYSHIWDVQFTWGDDFSASYSAECRIDPSHQRFGDASVDYRVVTPAGCITEGLGIFTATVILDGVEFQGQMDVILPALEHNYGEATYVWTESVPGLWSCHATMTCSVCDEGTEGHTVAEYGQVVEGPDNSDCCVPADVVYTAYFTSFPTQTKVVHREYNHDWDVAFSWSQDRETCVAAWICRKTVCIVVGGPGTGKSVLAINLLAETINRGSASVYVSKNSAPREVYYSKLRGTHRSGKAKFLFKGSGCFYDTPADTFDLILSDESHRLNEKSGLFRNKGENQVKEIINASRMSVFFIDEHQAVTVNDIGTVREIVRHANAAGAFVRKMELDSQFRCGGSDGYISWLDGILGFSETVYLDRPLDFDYDLRFYDDPEEMRSEIRRLNEVNNRSRMVAGYCYDWVSKNDPDAYDVRIPGTDFRMRWNLSTSKTWAIDEGSVEEIGCIHTCQGLEFDYVGVIIGRDLRYEDGKVVTDRKCRARTDQSLRGLSTKYPSKEEQESVADEIIRNTYKVLLSRGMKGCFIYCEDRPLQEYLRNSLRRSGLSRTDMS